MSDSLSMGEQLVRAIVGFPKFLLGFVVGFLVVTLVELDMFALVLAAVALGIEVGVLWAVFFFLVTWIVIRALSGLAGIAQAVQNVAATRQ